MISRINIHKLTIRVSLIVNLFFSLDTFSQGINHTWLLGYITSDTLMRLNIDSTNVTLITEVRKMPVQDTQGNVSDENGNFLMSSNGIWIANSLGDTMPNGSELNPNLTTSTMKPYGLAVLNGNIILPMPDDSNKYVLFHQTFGDFTNYSIEIFYTVIDKTLDGGKGDVISKNNIALSGAFGYGLTACKHGNGRDWWIVALNNTANIIHKFLLSPNNVQYVGSQNLNVPLYGDWTGQPVFSPDGTKFAYRHGFGNSTNWNQYMRLFHFDRCDATFTLDSIINYSDSLVGFGTAFSANSRFLYCSSYNHLYQMDTDSLTALGSLQLVATKDTFASPSPPFYTNFYSMYLAANSKIYITSTSSVVDLHFIDDPDTAGLACDVHLHDLHLPKFNARSIPNHPNYYLGTKIGSPCDSLTTIQEIEHNFHFSLFPNPNSGNFKIIYLLPQNKSGRLEIFDVTGKKVYSQNLPQWSTLQYISLPNLSSGIYNCTITSAEKKVNKKLIILNP